MADTQFVRAQPRWPANMGGVPKVKKAGRKGKDKTPYYFFLMEKKAELEKQGKLGNRTQDSLSREMFPIWNVRHIIMFSMVSLCLLSVLC